MSKEVQCSSGGETPGKQAAPDGGWAWVVLAASFLVMVLTVPIYTCIGIFYKDLQKEFRASNAEMSWVAAIILAVLHAGGPLSSVLMENYGCRATVIVGGIVSGLGMTCSSLAQTLVDLYITAVITGLGLSMCFQPSVTILGHYFVRRRVFANILCSMGTALGQCVLPMLSNALQVQFGWRGSFLVLGGLLLNCCVCGAVMRPMGTTPKVKGAPVQPTSLPAPAKDLCIQKQQEGWEVNLWGAVSALVTCLRKYVAIDLMRSNPRFRTFALGVSWMILGLTLPMVYLVPCVTERGVGQDRAALLLAAVGLANAATRPVAALVFGMPPVCRGSRFFVYVLGGAILLNGLSNCVCVVVTDFGALLAYVLAYGISLSVVWSLFGTVLMEVVEMSCFPLAMGLTTVMESVMILLGPPLAGVLVDYTGLYSCVFIASSVNVYTAGLYILVSFYLMDRQSHAEEQRSVSPAHDRIRTVSISLVDLPSMKAPDTEILTNV